LAQGYRTGVPEPGMPQLQEKRWVRSRRGGRGHMRENGAALALADDRELLHRCSLWMGRELARPCPLLRASKRGRLRSKSALSFLARRQGKSPNPCLLQPCDLNSSRQEGLLSLVDLSMLCGRLAEQLPTEMRGDAGCFPFPAMTGSGPGQGPG
jgi:hypothetical protein